MLYFPCNSRLILPFLVLVVALVSGFLPFLPSHAAKMAPLNYAASPSMRLPELDQTGTTIEYDTDDQSLVRSVPAVMTYVTKDTELVQLTRLVDGSDTGIQGARWESTPVRIYNGATGAVDDRPNLHRHGFELQQHPFTPRDIDFLDSEQVIDRYYPATEQFLKDFLGEKVAVVKAFDHNIRIQRDDDGSSQSPQPSKNTSGSASTARQPVSVVHGDYTHISAPQRLKYLAEPPKLNDVLRTKLTSTPNEPPRSLLDQTVVKEAIDGKRRFSFINVWRSIDPVHPVQQMPLACIDTSSVRKEDFRTLQLHYPDRVGENYLLCYPKEDGDKVSSSFQPHVWFYFREMTFDDVILLKQWDSHGGLARGLDRDLPSYPSTFSFHAAFCDPSSPKNAVPRKSIETRCVAIWEVDGEDENN